MVVIWLVMVKICSAIGDLRVVIGDVCSAIGDLRVVMGDVLHSICESSHTICEIFSIIG